jgi:predicted transcriptional regulator
MKRKTARWRQGWTSWRADPALLRALDEVADQRDMSRSAVMRAALAAYCQAHGVQMERPAVEAGIE